MARWGRSPPARNRPAHLVLLCMTTSEKPEVTSTAACYLQPQVPELQLCSVKPKSRAEKKHSLFPLHVQNQAALKHRDAAAVYCRLTPCFKRIAFAGLTLSLLPSVLLREGGVVSNITVRCDR